MISLFKFDKPQKNKSFLIDDLNITSLSSKSDQNLTKENFENEPSFLEVKIISSGPDFQEIEITCGNKKVRRKIYKNFLPQDLADNFIDQPSKSLGATHLNSLNKQQEVDNLVFKEKLLNALAKISLLIEANKINDTQYIDYQKIWDGQKRINIDEQFNLLNEEKKQEAFDQEILKREQYLTTPDKAILVAAINSLHTQNYKINREIISQNFNDISDTESFKKFIDEIFSLIENKEKILENFFENLTNSNAAKTQHLLQNLDQILAEPDKIERYKAIKNFKNLVDKKPVNEIYI